MRNILAITTLLLFSAACHGEAPTCRPGYELKLSADCAWVEVSCDIANGEGLREENGNCRLVRCNSDFHQFGNGCAANTIACTVENGSGESTWDGSIYGPCTVNSCAVGYHVDSNVCISNSRACNVPNGAGTQVWSTTWGQCTVQSCNTGYRIDGNACVLIPPTTALPRFPAAQVANASSKSGYRFWDDANGSPFSSHAFLGATYTVLAYESFAGNTSTDAKVLANMRYTMSRGREPQSVGGYSAQHELHYYVAAVFVKRTPRLWNQLTAAEKGKLDTILKAALVGNAYSCSSENPQIKQNITPIKNIVGDQMWWRNAPNFQNACPAVVMTGYLYFGTTEANNILNNFKKGEFAAHAQSIGLPRIYEGYRLDGPPGDRGGPRPTATEVETAIKNWKWARNGAGGTAYVTHMTRMLELAFDNPVQPGLNNGAGFTINGQSRGKIASNAAGLPNRGVMGMANEFDTSDAGGPRSAMSYVVTGTRIVLDMMLLLQALDVWELTPALKARVDIGMTDIKYKNDNGYLSHSKGGRPSANNEDWTQPRYNNDWGMNYTLGTWFDVIKRME